MRLDREWIERHIPHQGNMCLLDEVQAWGDDLDRMPERDASRPGQSLARVRPPGLGMWHRVRSPGDGLCTGHWFGHVQCGPGARISRGVRDVMLYVTRIDDVETDIVARAELIASYQGAVSYSFTVRADGRVLLTGRATIVLDPAALKPSPVRAST